LRDSKIEGRDKLVQDIIKRILTLRGSNKLEPSWGTNFYSLIGNTTDNENRVREGIPVMIKNLEELIIEEQSLNPDLDPSEKLLSLTLENLSLDDELLG